MIVEGIAADTGEILSIWPRGIELPGRVSRVGLELPDNLSFDDWSSLGSTLKSVEGSIMWWLGDWARYGQRYGEKYTEVAKATGYDYGTIANAKSIADRIEFSRRRENLSWSHHAEIAGLLPEEADQLLDEAEAEGLSRNELRRRVSQKKAARTIAASTPGDDTCTVADLFRLAQQIRAGERPPYGSIYADPPWQYDNQATRAATGNHYQGMSVDELCALPIPMLVADNAHLHMWTTNGFLFECPKIFDAWGFEFRTSFVWVKPQIGIGNYWRNSHEIMLTGVRGDAKRFNDHSMPSWLECARGPHSEKPEQVRALIERASPGPYLELFGRKAVNGWAVWGNQIERSILTHDVKEVA
jgi:N6-adenosine-specific RNA methylase IME4